VAGACEVWLFAIESKLEATARLRERLGAALGMAANEIPITAGEGGKPHLERGGELADLRFNLSHSGNVAAVAIAEGVEVGVDVEGVTEKRPLGYVRDWTRREAYLKGTGAGLRGSPRHLAFEPAGDGRWRVLESGETIAGWLVHDLEAPDGFACALAAGSEVDVRVRVDPSLVDRR
jgi:4'-phosphopantetheinyl transferase